jgi:uncharacterized membrane protein
MAAYYLAIARAVHILALVHWIGGVAFVTTIVLPNARRISSPAEAVAAFESFERRFAAQVRISVLLVGFSGIYMLSELNAWSRFGDSSFWWLDLMVAVWLAFALTVYVLEPLLVHDAFRRYALRSKDRAFTMAIRLHMIALLISSLAIVAGVLGANDTL